MEWINVETKKDIKNLMERVEEFHDWYVAGFSYDPLARAEDDDSNLARFEIDTREVLHFHSQALIAENKFANRMTNLFNISVKKLLDTLLDDNTEYPKIEVPEKFKQKLPSPSI